ncbi:MAG: O-antigen ligase family protein [Gemmatimonadota bacterium]|nr:O-antigen ligase family protein [Gemmatimonadota bacterium]
MHAEEGTPLPPVERPGSAFVALITGLAVYQLYVPLGGSVHATVWLLFLVAYPALSLVGGLPSPAALRSPPFLGLAVLIVAFTVSSALSPNPAAGLRMVLFTSLPAIAFLVGHRLGVIGHGFRTVRWLVAWSLPVAALNVVFFLSPGLELQFLASFPARFVVEPDTLTQLFVPSMGNNVLNPGKAGTLFVNANVASIFFGIGLCSSVFLWRERRRPLAAAVAFAFLLAFLATGSRAGLLAGVGTMIWVLALTVVRARGTHLHRTTLLAGTALGLVILLPMSGPTIERILSPGALFDPRTLIWFHAAQLILAHPVTGVGFGGWELTFPAFASLYGLAPSYPPHSAYLIAWLWAGVTGLVGMLLVTGGTLLAAARLARDPALVSWSFLASAVIMWCGVQLAFTNFALAEPRIGGVLFLTLGTAFGYFHSERIRRAPSRPGLQGSLPANL